MRSVEESLYLHKKTDHATPDSFLNLEIGLSAVSGDNENDFTLEDCV